MLRRPAARAAGATRVAVAADHHLVAESVRAALHTRGYDVLVVRWPTSLRPVPDPPVPAAVAGPPGRTRPGRGLRPAAGPPPAAAVLLSDLLRGEQVEASRRLIARLRVPWLVLAGVPRGPAWGAVYEVGAQLVVETSTGLDEVCDLIDGLVEDQSAVADSRRQRRRLVRAWRELAREREALAARVETLTVREEEVLQALHAGLAVREIAVEGDVAEATVRSQVKSILRKLEVSSQIAAVAAYEEIQSDPPGTHGPAD